MSISRRFGERAAASLVARRSHEGEAPRRIYARGRLRVDFDAYEVWVDGRRVHLMRREFQLLRFFVQSANRVFDRTQILASVWPRARVNPRTVDVLVYRLRRRIERDPVRPQLLVTVRGVGWRFDEHTLVAARETAAAHHVESHTASRSHCSY